MRQTHKTIPALALLCVATSGACLVGPAWIVDYEYNTSALRVETEDAEISLESMNHGRKVDLLVADNFAQITFAVSPGNIVVSIENRQSGTLDLNLEDVSFIDSEGHVQQLLAWSVSESGKRKALIEVDRVRQLKGGSTFKFSLWPEEWTWKGSDGQHLAFRDLTPFGGSSTAAQTRAKARQGREEDVGQQFEIVMPVQVGPNTYSYRFIFTATALRLKRVLWA